MIEHRTTSNTSLDSLAIMGGRPRFDRSMHVGTPNQGNREIFNELVRDILDRNWLTNNGPLVQEFESKVSKIIGVRNCVAVCNATIGIELTIRALGLSGEVIVPSFTFVATAHALQWQEITPVFCDIDPATHNIDPKLVESLVTPRTTGIIGVHTWGRPCDIDELQSVANRNGLQLMFDSAHAFMTTYSGEYVGNFGRAEVFSFHATKFFNTFEGGAIVTNDDELASKLRLMRNFGFQGADNVIHLGVNGKMNEICAAMGLASFDRLEGFLLTNKHNYEQYKSLLDSIPGCSIVEYETADTRNYQYIVVEIDESITGLSRDHLLSVLQSENVLARRYFYPGCHKMEPYVSYYPHAGLLLPQTESLCKRVLCLPNGTSVSPKDVECICQIIREAIEHKENIKSLLKER